MAAGSILTLPVEFRDVSHNLRFTYQARLPIDTPSFALDLSPSTDPIHPRDVITWTLGVRNLGAIANSTIVTALLPFDRPMVTGTLKTTTGSASELSGTIHWAGSIPSGTAITLTYQMSGPLSTIDRVYYGGAAVSDGVELWQTGNWLKVQPYRFYLPIGFKQSRP